MKYVKPGKKPRKLRFLIWLLAVLIALGISLGLFWEKLPYQLTIAREIKNTLEGYGLTVNSLEVDTINSKHAVISGVDIGAVNKIRIKKIELDYVFKDFISNKQLQKFEGEGLELLAYKKNDKWVVGGLEPFFEGETDSDEEGIITDGAELRKILPQVVTLTNSELIATDGSFELTLPFNLETKLKPDLEANLETTQLAFRYGNVDLTGNDLLVNAKLDETKREWHGSADVSGIYIQGIDYDIPQLKLQSKFVVSENDMIADIVLNDDELEWKIYGALAIPFDGRTGSFKIEEMRMPLEGGIVSTANVDVPLDNSPITAQVNFENLDLAGIITKFKEEATATGKISGSVPITYKNNEIWLQTETDEQLSATPLLKLNSKKFTLASKPYDISGNNLTLDGAFDPMTGLWQGKGLISNLIINGVGTEIPPLRLVLNYKLMGKNLDTTINIADKDKALTGSISFFGDLNDPQGGVLKIKNFKFPWGGGNISTGNLNVPLKMDKPLPINIKLNNIELSYLMDELTSEKVKATGQISGEIPIVYYPDGHVELKEGSAGAIAEGLISVSPTLLAGDNQQLEIARTALENFHYTTLKIGVSSVEDKSMITLTLEGNNPEAFNGRPIKLNVNIGGDVMPLIQQSILPLNDIKQLLDLKDTP